MTSHERRAKNNSIEDPGSGPALRLLVSASSVWLCSLTARAQGVRIIPDTQQDMTWWYVTLGALVLALVLAVRWVRNSKGKGGGRVNRSDARDPRARPAGAPMRMPSAPNRSREVEWLKAHGADAPSLESPKRDSTSHARAAEAGKESRSDYLEPADLEPRAVEIEEVELSFADLPVSRFKRLESPKKVDLLPTSDDPGLLNAIEQTREGMEYDEAVRLIATKVLAAFRTENSISALKQIALYDISSNVRSKAVGILSDFDHETVFESLVIASADPSRDVRAAAARGLARLSIDRADAWARVAECGDGFRMSRLAKAAVECEIVARSVDRLVHLDEKVANEAFTLFVLLARGGDTSTFFDILESAQDPFVKLALIQTLEAALDGRFVAGLVNIADDPAQNTEVRAAADRAAKTIRALRTIEPS